MPVLGGLQPAGKLLLIPRGPGERKDGRLEGLIKLQLKVFGLARSRNRHSDKGRFIVIQQVSGLKSFLATRSQLWREPRNPGPFTNQRRESQDGDVVAVLRPRQSRQCSGEMCRAGEVGLNA